MLKKLLLVATLAVAGGATFASPGTAATTAVATANVNLRAGPSTAYPAVTLVPAGTPITTFGCVTGYTWCDVAFAGYRGWVAADYIQLVYGGAPVVLTATVATAVGIGVVAYNRAYWDRYYSAYPWYGRWGAYPAPRPNGPYPVAPRVTSTSRAAGCANGVCTGASSATGRYGGTTSQTRTCADGSCTATRNTTGAYGGSATRTRNCTSGSGCSASRSGTTGGGRSFSGSRSVNRR
ncbi:SH3 domain-containing protein [Ancylobacter pratisalsi]|uniref:SH3 domain-containing protein n=1 Tax=Ancylobacter pratisalsi TaxID=1745854 RepID=A0A6P1YR81_9HYPH|nr:SH3 domain-containing protein [Ancylobacter pratisalsi]QIB35206.1 SH3 domain-containing protein [Ancylobacter pratisalsi]